MSKKHKEAIQKQFTKTAEAFSVTAVRDAPEVVAEKVDFIKPQPADLTLDVACGPGTLVLSLAPRVAFARGIDLTAEMLRRARQTQLARGILNAAFDAGDAEHLPYPDAAFHLVTCQCSIHHMPKAELVIREMARVTRLGGRVVIIDSLGPESDAKFELHNRIEGVRDPSHTLSLRLTAFLELFDQAGLEIARQALKRRQRSFNQWMRRAGLEPGDKRYDETRRLMEESAAGDRAGFAPQVQGDDLQIVHNECMFLLTKQT